MMKLGEEPTLPKLPMPEPQQQPATPPSKRKLNKKVISIILIAIILCSAFGTLGYFYLDLKNKYESLQLEHKKLQDNYDQLKADLNGLNNSYNGLKTQYDYLSTQYNDLNTQYQKSLDTWQSLQIGTALETYYDYVRANSLTFGLVPVGEERWWSLPNYYDQSVEFAANLASHDIGNLWWPTLEVDCGYKNYTGEYSYETSSRIMLKTMNLAGVSSSDSNVMKMEKVLAFISSTVHYEHKLLDHMWFPCETLAFHSGDCTSFSILAAAMLEEAGMETAIGLFTNSTVGGHAMILVHMDNLGSYKYRYYTDLTGHGLTSGKWIIVEPQCASLAQQETILDTWIAHWSLVACAEVPYGP